MLRFNFRPRLMTNKLNLPVCIYNYPTGWINVLHSFQSSYISRSAKIQRKLIDYHETIKKVCLLRDTLKAMVVAQGSASYPQSATHSCSSRCLFFKWSSMYASTMWPVEMSMFVDVGSSFLQNVIKKVFEFCLNVKPH